MSGSRMTEELKARRIDAPRVIGTCQIRCRARLWPCIADRCIYTAERGIGNGEIALCKIRLSRMHTRVPSANFSQSRIRVRAATRQRFAVTTTIWQGLQRAVISWAQIIARHG
jgi:hypothetical protein